MNAVKASSKVVNRTLNALNRSTWMSALLAASILLVPGCATQRAAEPASPVETHWGESYRQVVAEQIANPEAGQDSRPPEGVSASEADAVVEYQRDRQSPDYQNTPRRSVVGELE